jgi:endo-1,4-beta-xylanase
MEAILSSDGGLDFRRPDALLQFAEGRDLRVHGHVLVWYTDRPPSFVRLLQDRRGFTTAYDAYVRSVAGRYRGRVRGWDVVNEAVEDDGDALRACLWTEMFGDGYIERAFHVAREADPNAPLFLNDFGLESHPKKRRRFLQLAETLLKRGAPLTGLGTQLHMDWTQGQADIDVMMKDLASLGLPIHVSELDVSTQSGGRARLESRETRLASEAGLVGATAQAFMRLPPKQRYAFTAWGLRDKDSWLRLSPGFGDPNEAPTLFDDDGRPKPSARALATVLKTRGAL